MLLSSSDTNHTKSVLKTDDKSFETKLDQCHTITWPFVPPILAKANDSRTLSTSVKKKIYVWVCRYNGLH